MPDAEAYERVFGNARSSRDRYFIVLSRSNDGDVPRLGLAISKKNCRKATGRNRLKRLVRESFRRNKAALAGLDLVVLAQPPAALAGNRSIFDSLDRHWQKARKSAGSRDRRRN